MNKDLKTRINQFNKIKYNKDNSKRIIIGTLNVKSGYVWSCNDNKWTVTTAPKDK
jgi:hypothetical protein